MDYRDDTLQLRNGLTVATRTWGHGDCNVLAVHGWLDNVATFSRLAPALEHATIVAVDLPGHGQSDWRSADSEYHYVDWIPIVWDILEALGWDRVTLLGHSMGAGIVALFAGVFPERVERMICIEGLGPFTTPPNAIIDNMRRSIEARPIQSARAPRVLPSVDAAVERKLAALPYLGDTARLLVERGTRPVEGGVAYSHDPRLTGRSLLRYTEEQVMSHLRAITAPTLLIWASHGLSYPAESGDGDERTAAIGNLEIVRVEGDHHVHLTQPDRIIDFIRAFLD